MSKYKRILGILILLISLLILLWGIWPFGVEVRYVPINPSDMQLPETGWIENLVWFL